MGVVWVSTDYKFDLLRLVAILEGQLHQSIVKEEMNSESTTDPPIVSKSMLEGSKQQTISEKDHHDLVMLCLSRVYIFARMC